jgi:hypothetical protein
VAAPIQRAAISRPCCIPGARDARNALTEKARRKRWGYSRGSSAVISPGFNPPFGGHMLNSLLLYATISTWSTNGTNIAST